MFLKRLRLTNFRNHKKRELKFGKKLTLVVGPNTSGKTNLLEAIGLLSTGKSLRAEVEQEMIAYDSQIARIKGRVFEEELTDLEIILTRGEIGGEKVPKKKYLINNVGKKASSFVGNLKSVYFGPESLYLVTGSPATRRSYLDYVLSQVDREYVRASLSYEKGLRSRNKLLQRIRDEGVPRSHLSFWSKLLVKNGEYITGKREEFINACNFFKNKTFPSFNLFYNKNPISPSRLEERLEDEIASGMTLVGPHRDDFSFMIKERNLSKFGSRGEQRLSVLWLKLNELEFIEKHTKKRPLLLLDDILSELDKKRRETVLKPIFSQQTIITTTDLLLVDKAYKKKAEVIEFK